LNSSPKELTLLFSEMNSGNKDVINEIFSIVYKELKKIASKYLYEEYGERTIETTELVHEAYIKIIGAENVSIENKSHFFGIASNAMRQLLVDFARKRNAEKRGWNNHARVTLVDGLEIYSDNDLKIIELDDALKKLALVDERLCKIVELRYFAGLNIDETAAAIDVSPATVKREWSLARAWLFKEMNPK
jgi:RNA polymerase sigma factor (TIGR02999 family)